ncbi:F-actin-capping protein subunit alpha [Caligus rogercresseyi]|uniref:F-actin-capping protein subunit alpha n=1 Tax=Caligus rogercresseyi TaxID=217165 RepID=A0A7T8H2L0_CALRO|nr:F-actin-capping protein subunit alpha [Caligus rogercresseyi]
MTSGEVDSWIQDRPLHLNTITLRKEASDYQPHAPDKEWEGLRAAIQAEATNYTLNHFKHGICCTFLVDSEENGMEDGAQDGP